MREGAVLSAGMHVTVIALAIVGLPHFLEPEPLPMLPVPVEVVTVDDLAKPPPKPAPPAPPKPEAKAPPPAPPAPPEPPKAAEPPPPPPVAEPVPPPKPEPAPPKPKVAEKPKPKPKPEPVKKAEAAPPKPALPPTETPKRKPKPPPDAFQTLLKNLEAEKRKQQVEVKPENLPPKEPQVAAVATQVPKPQRSEIDKRRIAATLQQLVAQQVSPCWSLPAGAKDVGSIRIGVRIALNPDGSLRGIPVPDDMGRMNSDAVYRTVAESALRALRNPRCSPLRLPLQYYDMWKDVIFIFDPKEMVGQ